MRKRMIGVAGALLAGGFILYFWSGTLLDKGVDPKADGTNDYAIVLGARVKENGEPSLSLQYRLETAIEYLKKYPHVKVIVSWSRERRAHERSGADVYIFTESGN